MFFTKNHNNNRKRNKNENQQLNKKNQDCVFLESKKFNKLFRNSEEICLVQIKTTIPILNKLYFSFILNITFKMDIKKQNSNNFIKSNSALMSAHCLHVAKEN